MARRGSSSTVESRLRGMTMLGNTARHQLIPGNRLGSHAKVYRQLRKRFGLSAG